MIDGTYQTELDTPLGRKLGKVSLRTEGDVVFADIDAPLIGKKSAKGRIEGDTFTAEGEFKVALMGKVKYSLRGQVVGDDLLVSFDTSKGAFDLVGKRI